MARSRLGAPIRLRVLRKPLRLRAVGLSDEAPPLAAARAAEVRLQLRRFRQDESARRLRRLRPLAVQRALGDPVEAVAARDASAQDQGRRVGASGAKEEWRVGTGERRQEACSSDIRRWTVPTFFLSSLTSTG